MSAEPDSTAGEAPIAARAHPIAAFNLLDEPWLPVQWRAGGTEDVGLRTLFDRAHEVADLAESVPTSYVALHRLLLAITHRALTRSVGRWTTADRAHWLRESLPSGALTDYLEQWRERFWLFHPTHPFMQVAALAAPLPPKADKRFGAFASGVASSEHALAPKPWSQIALESASGNNAVLFDHSVDPAPVAITAATALRALCGYLQFAPGQPVKALCKSGNDLSGPLFNSLAVLPVGRHLVETLALALPASPLNDDADDVPAWERPAPTLGALMANATVARGPCDRFTRLSRATLLLPERDGMVRRLLFAEGLALQVDSMAPDPMVSYRPGANDSWVRVSFREGRAAWRDLGALLPDPSGRLAQPAPVLENALRALQAAGRRSEALGLVVAGIAADQGKMLRGRIEQYRLPVGALDSAATATEVRAQLARAEEYAAALKSLSERLLLSTLPDPGHRDSRTLARRIVEAGPLQATFFAQAERDLAHLLEAIGRAELDPAHTSWSRALLEASTSGWQAINAVLGDGPRALRARALHEGRFRDLIRPLLPTRAAAHPNDVTEPAR